MTENYGEGSYLRLIEWLETRAAKLENIIAMLNEGEKKNENDEKNRSEV